MSRSPLSIMLLLLLGAGGGAAAAEYALPARPHPWLACDAEELARLKAALAGTGPARDAVAAMVARAKAAAAAPLEFPPRGGQHNQWYQCATCEMGLTTLDATHHQCPKCLTVYSGPPYDDVLFKTTHSRNFRRALDAAWGYALTGDATMAAFTKRVLLGYAERYRQYPYHNNRQRADGVDGGHISEQTLGEASLTATCIAPAYDLIYATLTAEEHAAVREGLLRPLLENLDRHKAGKSNWQSWHNAAMITGGMLLGETAWIRQALTDPHHGFAFQMAASVTAEGMWYENSWGYHFYTLTALVHTAEAARRLGVDLWGDPRFARMFTLPAQYLLPGGALPRFGDDVNTSAVQSFEMEAAYRALRDPALLAALPAAPAFHGVQFGRPAAGAGGPAPLASTAFPGAGHAILRTGAPANLVSVLTFGPFGGFHGHFDKLSFVLYGHDRELGVDPGRAASQAYRLAIHSNWYRATLSHNTVVVDRASQQGAAGKLLAFAPEVPAVTARCDAGYPGVRHTRTLVQQPAYLLVVDDLTGDAPHRYDWLYHSRGTRATCAAAEAAAQPEDGYPGLIYLQDLRAGRTDGAITVQFAGEAVTTYLHAAAARDTGVRVADGPGSSVLERVPLVMLTREGAAARFVVALEPVKTGTPPTITAVEAAEADGGLTVRITRGGNTDTIRIAEQYAVTVER
ncbi:MAG TPA: heparinase II/III family protein [Armatimonadota bacterium]|nr:heparinase II/III family protein [Armatimonadota bacterium]